MLQLRCEKFASNMVTMQGAMQSQVWAGQSTGASLHVTGTKGVLVQSNQGRASQGSRSYGVRASADRDVKANAVAAPPAIAQDRLVARVEERDGFFVLKDQYREGINPSEKVCPAFLKTKSIVASVHVHAVARG